MAARKKASEKPAPEPVSAEMLAQLMGQLQSLATEVSELRRQVVDPAPAFEPEAFDSPDPEDRVTDEEAAALLEAFDLAIDEAEPESATVDSDEADVSLEAEPTVEPSSVEPVELTDDAIAAAMDEMEPVAQATADQSVEPELEVSAEESTAAAEPAAEPEPEPEEEEFFGELLDLSEDALAQLVRQNISQQAESIDAAQQSAQAEAEGVLSADALAELLQEPDPVGDGVPAQAAAMSDDELAALLNEANNLNQSEAEVAPRADVEPESSATAEAVHPAAAVRLLAEGEFDLGAVRAVPAHLAIRAMALPICFEEGKVVCRVAEPIDRSALDRLSKEIGLGVIPKPTPITEVVAGLRQAYSEISDLHARHAMIQGSQKPLRGLGKLARIWKKGA